MRRECLLDGVVLALEKRGIDHLVAIRCLKNLLSSEDGKAVLSALLRLQKKVPLEKIRRLLEVLGEE